MSAFDSYSANYEAVLEIFDATDDCYRPYAGRRQACESINGAVLVRSVDLGCQLTLGGERASLTFDFPDAVDCLLSDVMMISLKIKSKK